MCMCVCPQLCTIWCDHEAFYLSICFWPERYYFFVLYAKLTHVTGEFPPLNWKPLSGIPWREKMVSNFGKTVLAERDKIISTSGNRLYSFMIMSKLSPEGKEPAKSMTEELYVSSGSGMGCRVSRGLWPGWDALYGIQDFTVFSTNINSRQFQEIMPFIWCTVLFWLCIGEPDGQWL